MYISGQSIDNFLVNQLVKELLKSDSNCFAKMKKGPVFLTHSVYAVHKLYTEFTTNREWIPLLLDVWLYS